MKNKLTTIPRLELQAALLASRIKLTVTQEMDVGDDMQVDPSDVIDLF